MGADLLRQPPETFSRLFQLLHQDVALIYPSLEAWIDDNLVLEARDRPVLKAYLDRILDGRFTDAQLRGLIQRTDADWSFNSSGARQVLEQIRRRL